MIAVDIWMAGVGCAAKERMEEVKGKGQRLMYYYQYEQESSPSSSTSSSLPSSLSSSSPRRGGPLSSSSYRGGREVRGWWSIWLGVLMALLGSRSSTTMAEKLATHSFSPPFNEVLADGKRTISR